MPLQQPSLDVAASLRLVGFEKIEKLLQSIQAMKFKKGRGVQLQSQLMDCKCRHSVFWL